MFPKQNSLRKHRDRTQKLPTPGAEHEQVASVYKKRELDLFLGVLQ